MKISIGRLNENLKRNIVYLKIVLDVHSSLFENFVERGRKVLQLEMFVEAQVFLKQFPDVSRLVALHLLNHMS